MDPAIEGIKKFISSDKRKCDRVVIPLGIFLSLPSEQAWTGPLQVHDIGGYGLKFAYDRVIPDGTELNIKITFPEPTERAINAQAVVAWTKLKNPTTHFVGIKISQMSQQDRKRYVLYICDKIILAHLKKASA